MKTKDIIAIHNGFESLLRHNNIKQNIDYILSSYFSSEYNRNTFIYKYKSIDRLNEYIVGALYRVMLSGTAGTEIYDYVKYNDMIFYEENFSAKVLLSNEDIVGMKLFYKGLKVYTFKTKEGENE